MRKQVCVSARACSVLVLFCYLLRCDAVANPFRFNLPAAPTRTLTGTPVHPLPLHAVNNGINWRMGPSVDCAVPAKTSELLPISGPYRDNLPLRDD